MKHSEYALNIVNLVMTANVEQQIDLVALSKQPNIAHDPKVYHCAYVKDQNMKGKVSIFASGKMISMGTRKKADAVHDLRYVVRRLKKVNAIKQTSIKIKIQNMVAMINLNRPINLTKFANDTPRVVFEPEQFPGAICSLDNSSGATALVFGSGKVILLGMKSSRSMNEFAKHVVKQIRKYT
jgi:transcription initiation factor TFIID TATA-box-binding protein